MLLALAACANIAFQGITIDTKAPKTVQIHKIPFTLSPGSKSFPTYFSVKIPTNSIVPIPVTVRFKSYLRNTSTAAPALERMLLLVHSSHSNVYDDYNLQRIEESPFGFKCSVKNGFADFSLEREGGAYDNKGFIEATLIRMPEKVKRSSLSGDLQRYEETYELYRKGDYPVEAAITRKVGPAMVPVPTWLTISIDGKQAYHVRSGVHKVVLHKADNTEKGSKVEIKLYTQQTFADQKPKISIVCYPIFSDPKVG